MSYRVVFQSNARNIQTVYWNGSMEHGQGDSFEMLC
jgi:hypothetical protein